MNIHFTKTKKLMFDEFYNFLFDGVSDENYKKLDDLLPLKENGEKSGIMVVHMGSISGDIISIMKSITNEVKKENKQDVYIYEGSTLEDFWYYAIKSHSRFKIDEFWEEWRSNGYMSIPDGSIKLKKKI